MMLGDFDPGAALALAAAIVVILLALAVAFSRALLAIALMTAVMGAALAVAFLALDAPDLALVQAIIGVAFIPLAIIGAMLLTAPSARARAGGARIGAIAAAVAVGAGLLWAVPDLPLFGVGGDTMGQVFVNRATYEIGARDGVAAVTGNYRAIDSLAQIAALMTGVIGLVALLGFGERAGLPRAEEEGE
jgi:multisubunit Na+/H+ antiporter MnhB subunit